MKIITENKKRGRPKKNKTLIEKIESKKIFGFTLIELLAVIIILGVLMIIAIPSVTEYISSSRKSAYISTAGQYISGARNKINAAEIPMFDVDATYYVPTSCISLEKGGDSPFGEIEEGYIVVTYDGHGYDYYFTVRDSSNQGILLTADELLDEDRIITGLKDLNEFVAIEGREKVLILQDCGATFTEYPALETIPEQGKLDEVTENVAPPEPVPNPNPNPTPTPTPDPEEPVVTRNTPIFGVAYNCVMERDPSQQSQIVFYSDGNTAVIYSADDYLFSNAATIGYKDNMLTDKGRENEEIGEVLDNGNKIELYDSMDIPKSSCTLVTNTIKLNKVYEGVYVEEEREFKVAITFYEDGKVLISGEGEGELEHPMKTFAYGNGYLYSETFGVSQITENGTKINVDGTILTLKNN